MFTFVSFFCVFIWYLGSLNSIFELCRIKKTEVTQLSNVGFCSPVNTHYFQVLLPITTSSSVLSLYTQAFLFAKFHAASYYTCVLLQKQPLLGFYLFRGSFIFLVLPLISLQRLLNSLGLNFPAE